MRVSHPNSSPIARNFVTLVKRRWNDDSLGLAVMSWGVSTNFWKLYFYYPFPSHGEGRLDVKHYSCNCLLIMLPRQC